MFVSWRIWLSRFAWKAGTLRPRLIAIAVGLIGALLSASLVMRLGGFEFEVVRPLLYYQKADYQTHQPDPNPDLMYRLRPGTVTFPGTNGYTVHVNALGARGPERPAQAAPGVFRIVALGGSNVYGLGLADDQTWPARLEARLNADDRGRFEVLNFGACAYVGIQMATLGRELVERLDPDLVIYAPSNGGPRAFLWNEPVAPYFRRMPVLWRGLFSPECLARPSWVPYEAAIAVVSHLALPRFFAARRLDPRTCNWLNSSWYEPVNVRASNDFLHWVKGKAEVCGFLCPAALRTAKEYDEFGAHFRDTGVPVLALSAEGKPDAFWDVHPPAEGAVWYADELATWLRAQGLVPPRFDRPAASPVQSPESQP